MPSTQPLLVCCCVWCRCLSSCAAAVNFFLSLFFLGGPCSAPALPPLSMCPRLINHLYRSSHTKTLLLTQSDLYGDHNNWGMKVSGQRPTAAPWERGACRPAHSDLNPNYQMDGSQGGWVGAERKKTISN